MKKSSISSGIIVVKELVELLSNRGGESRNKSSMLISEICSTGGLNGDRRDDGVLTFDRQMLS